MEQDNKPAGMPDGQSVNQDTIAAKKQREELNRQKACEQLSSEGKKHFSLIEFDEEEELVTEIRKHPFGLFLILFIGIFVLLVSIITAAVISAADLNSFFQSSNANSAKGALVTIGFFIALLSLVGTFIGAFLYRSNVIYVTSEKIAQIVYTSLFHRKVSQLSIGDVQDVTVAQKGILAHLFGYGTLVVETAGEQQNYTFTFVPDPYKKSQDIVGAHERNLTLYGN